LIDKESSYLLPNPVSERRAWNEPEAIRIHVEALPATRSLPLAHRFEQRRRLVVRLNYAQKDRLHTDTGAFSRQ
jgi:hypothetical protein